MRAPILPLLPVLLFLLSACGGEPGNGTAWQPVREEALNDAQRAQRARALEARDAMFTELSEALLTAIEEQGAAEAINVCRCEAPQIAKRVAKEQGVAIGRTSFRLRNPDNAPPAWAARFVEQRAEDNVFVAHPDGRLGALLPIRLQNACLTCHGDPASIATDVRLNLDRFYPEDRATGFAQGDLRGWFWIEVPAGAR